MGGKFIRTIGQARATVAMTMMAACYNLKRLAKFLDDGVDAFYKNKPSKTEVRLQGPMREEWGTKTLKRDGIAQKIGRSAGCEQLASETG